MFWLRWSAQYVSKPTSIPGWDRRGDSVIVIGTFAFALWVSPSVLAAVPFLLGLRAVLDVASLRDIQRIVSSSVPLTPSLRRSINDLAHFAEYTVVALVAAAAAAGFAPLLYGDYIKRRAEAAGLDGAAAQSVLALAILTALTIILAIVYRKAHRVLPALGDPRLTPDKHQREAILEWAKINEHATFVVESAWVLLSVTIALVPTLFRADLGPNLVAGFAVPLLITHAREDFHHFQSESKHSDRPEEK